ncbi:MAG TPA: HAMP domain-containing sensor histidine kinase [Kofleriaceae bacterium]|nr:HAMP domain-containing sensor histidine kinase [Kofleriaceae bacterium]
MSGQRTTVELEIALLAAEEALRVRDDFMRLAGHELRSPLTAVQLQADALVLLARQGAPPDAIEERAERVRRSVHRLAWLVEEVVDLSRAVGGRLILHAATTDLVLMAHRVLDRFGPELRRAGCDARIDTTSPVLGSWDATRLEHAIGSLLLSAMKRGGRIEVEVHGEIETARLAVRDGGPGLAEDERALVFDSFERLLAGLQPGSSALGLWLARAVAEAHGGQLSLEPGRAELRLPKTGPARPGLIGET